MTDCRGLADCHTHTAFSFDAEERPERMAEQAVSLGLAVYGITDHCEMNMPGLDALRRAMTASVTETGRLSARYAGSGTRILTGLELGQPMQNLPETERFLKELPVDFIIGSLHNLAGEQDFYYLHYNEGTAAEYLARYFDELYEMICWGGFDSLGHLTYPLRYMVAREKGPVRLEDFQFQTDRILSALTERGLALELNTSGLTGEDGYSMPPLELLTRFRELGGSYVTLGSDAHQAGNIGKGIRAGAVLMKAAGFDSVTYFINREPVLLPISL